MTACRTAPPGSVSPRPAARERSPRRRWTHDGWVEGQTQITIENGELLGSVNPLGNLAVKNFEVGVAPIDIPEEVFGKPAQLTNVRVKLASPIVGSLSWTSDDDATGQLTLSLDLDWAITVNGNKTPLGTQHLPPVPVDVMVTGGGDHIDASIGMNATGELWNWAGLLEVTGLEMSLSAETVE